MDSEEENYAYSSDASIYAFTIDSIKGKYYTFTIDQLNRHIYNRDSLPVGSDTIVDRIIIDTLTVTGWVTLADTLYSVGDSIDLTSAINQPAGKGMKFKIYAADGGSTSEYTLSIHIHKQDPDSLVWEEMGLVAPALSPESDDKGQRVVLLNDDLWVYTNHTTAYRSSSYAPDYGWTEVTLSGLPETVVPTSVINFKDILYMLDAEGNLYASEDGKDWEQNAALGGMTSLIGVLPSNEVSEIEATLCGIRKNGEGKDVFCYTSNATEWNDGEAVPEGFPTQNIYSTIHTIGNGVGKIVAVGMPQNDDTATTPWFSMDGKGWASLATSAYDTYCPYIKNPNIMWYGGNFYIFGNGFENIYTSQTAIAWHETEEKFLLPEALKGKASYSMVVDKEHYIWIVVGGNGTTYEVWRGRLNRLGFDIQD